MRHLPKLICDVIPHKEQRYNTGGDYEKQHDDWFFTVSRMTPQEEFAILMHEQVEWFLCQMAGIKEKDITKFDLMWEKERLAGLHKDDDEPGLDKRAPYRNQHIFATKIEHMILKKCGVDIDEYNKRYTALIKNYK